MSPAALPVLRVAVVGHTNTGKTSLLRTLARDATFGEVSDRPATTRDVAGIALTVRDQPVIEIFDTPGLEDSIGLLEILDERRQAQRMDGPAQVEAFLASEEASGRFAQEAKALRQLLVSDAAVYVIDARDRVLPKHRDELEVLARCGRPIVPVLNFIASGEARVGEWREQLSRLNLHAVAEFDTVVYDFDGEVRLFEKMRSLLDAFRPTLDALLEERRHRRRELIEGSALLVAQLLLDAASAVEEAPSGEAPAIEEATRRLQDRLRAREQRCVDDLLRLHRFSAQECATETLPLDDGRWGLDLFSPAAMRRHGIRAGGGAAAGAAVGAGIDLVVGGLSLGAATAIGAAVGALLGALGGEGRRLVRRARGGNELRAGESTLRLLAGREIELARALLRRGHASQAAVRIPEASERAGRAGERQGGVGAAPSSLPSAAAITEVIAALRREQPVVDNRGGALYADESVRRVARLIEAQLTAPDRRAR